VHGLAVHLVVAVALRGVADDLVLETQVQVQVELVVENLFAASHLADN